MDSSKNVTKRKRSVRSVIKQIDKFDSTYLSDDSKRFVANVKSDAHDPSADKDKLRVAWNVFDKKRQRLTHAARKIKRLEKTARENNDELANANEERDLANARLAQLRFLFQIGDWANAIIKASASFEQKNTDIPLAHGKKCKAYHDKVKDLTGRDKQTAKNNAEAWTALKGQVCEYIGPLEAEVANVKTWHEGGRDEALAPKTILLDRIKLLTDEVGVTRTKFLEYCRYYHERNEAAHHPPPRLEDHLTADRKAIDWSSLRHAVAQRKADVTSQFESGELNGEHRDVFLQLIDSWWQALVKEWPTGGTPIITSHGLKVEKLVLEAKNPSDGKHDSKHDGNHDAYIAGKWYDLFKP